MIGLAINDILKNDTGVTALISADNIFPYIAEEGTNLPIIIYALDDVDPKYSKDGWAGDATTFHVAVYSGNFVELQGIVKAVRLAIEGASGEYDEVIIDRIDLMSMKEGFNDDYKVFANTMNFGVNLRGF